jgi:hypothetical protein
MKSKATTVEDYLAELPEERREALQAVRAVILDNLPKGCQEGMQYGMIGYFVPHSVYPAGYHCDPKQPLPFAALASQKNYMSIYLMCIYSDREHEKWFRDAWTKTGKKLDMGKSCVRFKKVEDVPLKVIGQAVKRVSTKRFIEHYESVVRGTGRKRSASPTKKKAVVKKTPRSSKPSTKKSRPRKKTTAGRPTKKKSRRQNVFEKSNSPSRTAGGSDANTDRPAGPDWSRPGRVNAPSPALTGRLSPRGE